MEACHIVLPTYNRRHVLKHTIPQYLALEIPLLVIDDGSTDGTEGWLRDLGIRVIRHPRRRGLPAARNTGLRASRAPWVLFGEDDVLFPSGHAQVLMAEAERLPKCAVVAGSLFAGASWRLPAERPPWESGNLLDAGMLLGNFAVRIDTALPLPTVHACALVDREAILAVGGYDERLTDSAFREESDCFARVWRSGRSVWLTPATWGIHVRHRLGGGCRGHSDVAAKVANRVSYVRNNSTYIDRHHRLWQQWASPSTPGRLKWRFFRRTIAQQISLAFK
jgi:glycosyltransferase involved in cell wall biosynthesis